MQAFVLVSYAFDSKNWLFIMLRMNSNMLSEMLLFIENLEYIRTIFPLDSLANVSYLWKWKTLWIEISWHKLAMWKAWIRQLCTMCTKLTTYAHRADNTEGSLSCKCKIQCNVFAVKYLICLSSYSNYYRVTILYTTYSQCANWKFANQCNQFSPFIMWPYPH